MAPSHVRFQPRLSHLPTAKGSLHPFLAPTRLAAAARRAATRIFARDGSRRNLRFATSAACPHRPRTLDCDRTESISLLLNRDLWAGNRAKVSTDWEPEEWTKPPGERYGGMNRPGASCGPSGASCLWHRAWTREGRLQVGNQERANRRSWRRWTTIGTVVTSLGSARVKIYESLHEKCLPVRTCARLLQLGSARKKVLAKPPSASPEDSSK